MKEIILCKYGEISLKGANRSYFEKMLRDILKRRTAPYGHFKIYSMQSTVYIEPLDDEADIESAYRIAKNTFGISAINRAIETEKNMEAILETVRTQFMPYIEKRAHLQSRSKAFRQKISSHLSRNLRRGRRCHP